MINLTIRTLPPSPNQLDEKRQYMREYCRKNRGHLRLMRKAWRHKNLERVRELKKTWRQKNAENYRAHANQWNHEHREIKNAHAAVYRALKRGLLTRPELCPRCQNKRLVEAHHHDYTKPIKVTWLCRKCHVETHDKQND
jgi:ribosomal protein S27AE